MAAPYRDGPPALPFPRDLGAPPERLIADPLLSLGIAAAIVIAAGLSAWAKDAWPGRFDGAADAGFALTTIIATALAAAVGAALGRGRPVFAFSITALLALLSGFGLWGANHQPYPSVVAMLNENLFAVWSLAGLALLLAACAGVHAAFGRTRTWEDGDRLRLALAGVLVLAAFYVASIAVFAVRWYVLTNHDGYSVESGPELSGVRTALFVLVAAFALSAGIVAGLGLRGVARRRAFVARVRAGAVDGWTVGWREGRRDLGLPHLWPGADEAAKILAGPNGDVAVVP